ncbi:teichuronopeptide biosynthesis TupA-like protein [Shimia isoporae]|uniref:Teichuronopeptide biosynthesis TupA-like protein n=1 Tax=Shimia isoporae TaxID=647720 RepID=A0A4V2Q277_9RHOB|nr:ATP-grasp fold amidoligase family protein [Shimia isoporae]TCL01391.1 teichuronopeptide biosynthesis TupA-like protein [Shimia isoporae]
MAKETDTRITARRIARETVKSIFEQNLFGAANPAPRGTLRGIDVLGTPTVTQKISRALQVFAAARNEVPDLTNPSTFFEKLTVSKFFAPVPMPSPADKLATGRFIPETAARHIRPVPGLWSGQSPITPEVLLQADLKPGRYFAKSNCGSYTNMQFTLPTTREVLEELEKRSTQWLSHEHGVRAGVWWYGLIRPQNLIEADLSPSVNSDLPDWKLYCGGGRVLAVQLDLDRHTNHRQLIFDRDFNFVPEVMFFPTGTPVRRPSGYRTIVKVVEDVAKPFEFARIDLYLKPGVLYLGEITLAPFGGQRVPQSEKLDRMMGDAWRSDFFA